MFDAAPAIGADRQPFATSSSPRDVRLSTAHMGNSSGETSTVHSLTSNSTLDGKLDFSTEHAAARKGMLERSIFLPSFKNDAADANLENAEEMQKNDPLATQIWRLYHKSKTQLPNAERMENLTWRMMAMSMRRAELDRNRGYGIRHITIAPFTHVSRKPLLTPCFFF